MKDKNLFRCLHGVIIPLLHGIKYYTPTEIMEHNGINGHKVDVSFFWNFIFFVEGSRIHNSQRFVTNLKLKV